MNIEQLLQRVVQDGASDGFISAGAPPSIKVDGKIFPITKVPVTDEEARELVLSTMREDQKETFLKHHECNYALSCEGLGRFRASAFELGLPPIIKELAMTNVAWSYLWAQPAPVSQLLWQPWWAIAIRTARATSSVSKTPLNTSTITATA